jgi:hypothetical protein
MKKMIQIKKSLIKILKKPSNVQSKNKLEISNLHTYKENVGGGRGVLI